MEHNYQIGRPLGRGSFATVHLARKNTNVCALKLIDLSSPRNAHNREEMLHLLQREVSIHSTSSHANVVTFIESFSYGNGRMMAIALEYCEGGDLANYFTRVRDRRRQLKAGGVSRQSSETFLSCTEIRHATSHILSGLAYLHSNGIVHRDIKGGNIYLVPHHLHGNNKETELSLTKYTLKIGDFGLAVRMDDDEDWDECQMTVCGTPSCLAPEVVRGYDNGKELHGITTHGQACVAKESASQGYGQPADLWSVGCLLYTMIVGRNPFALPSSHANNPNANNEDVKMARVAATIDRVAREDWAIPAYLKISNTLNGLLNQLLESRPRKRGSAEGILEFHPFFKGDASCSGEGTMEPLNEKENIENRNIASDRDEMAENDYTYQLAVTKKSFGYQNTVNTTSEITPIEGLNRLPTNKYEWTEGSKQFKAFLIKSHGIVIQELCQNYVGRWMHITSNGQLIFCDQSTECDTVADSSSLLDEAFQCAPSYINHSILVHYEPLASLLQPSNKRKLRLYKTAERLVQSVKASTPKIILYLCSPTSTQSTTTGKFENENMKQSSHRLFAKVMLMENGPDADIEVTYVEGTTFLIRNRDQEKGKMIIRWQNDSVHKETAIQFDTNDFFTNDLNELVSKQRNNESCTISKLSHHFCMVQSASTECLRIEQDCHSKQSSHCNEYPISVRISAVSSDRNLWVVLNDVSAR